MAAIGKLTIKRTDLIAKVKANLDAARKEHEARYGKPHTDAEAKKLVTKYRDDLAKYHQDVAAALSKLTKPEDMEDLSNGYQLDKLGIHVKLPKRPQIRQQEFVHAGYTEVIELLEMAQDETITLSGVQYESYLRGRIDHRRY